MLFGDLVEVVIDKPERRAAVFQEEDLAALVHRNVLGFFYSTKVTTGVGFNGGFIGCCCGCCRSGAALLPRLPGQRAQALEKLDGVGHAADAHGLDDDIKPAFRPTDNAPVAPVADDKLDGTPVFIDRLRLFNQRVVFLLGLIDHNLTLIIEDQTLDAQVLGHAQRAHVVEAHVPPRAAADLEDVAVGLRTQPGAFLVQARQLLAPVDLVVKVARQVLPAARHVGVLRQVEQLGPLHGPHVRDVRHGAVDAKRDAEDRRAPEVHRRRDVDPSDPCWEWSFVWFVLGRWDRCLRVDRVVLYRRPPPLDPLHCRRGLSARVRGMVDGGGGGGVAGSEL